MTTSGSTVTDTPDLDYTGADPFTFTVSDGHGGVLVVTVTLTIKVITISVGGA